MDTAITNDLDQELAALKAKAADYGARHKVIEMVEWPQGVRLAVNFTADFDTMLLRRLLNEPPQQLAKGEFGGRVGIWRLIELFDSHRIKATIFTPGRICELYPQAVRAASRSGHEIADHMWEHQVPKDPALERDHLRKACAALEKLTGRRPVGTRSWHSRELLLEEGFVYNSHDSLDHRPHYVSGPDGSGPLLNLPFHYAIHDAGWQVTRSTDGTTDWTSPTGHTYPVPPATYPVDTTRKIKNDTPVLAEPDEERPPF